MAAYPVLGERCQQHPGPGTRLPAADLPDADEGEAALDQMFLPYAVMKGGGTLYEHVQATHLLAGPSA